MKTSKWFGGAKESGGQRISDEHQVNEQLAVSGSVRGGQLVLNWTYNNSNYGKEAINDLAKNYLLNLELLIDHCVAHQKNDVLFIASGNGIGSPVNSFKRDTAALQVKHNKYLVPIKTTGNKIPLFIVVGGGATAGKFMKFARMMDPDQPVYALQPPIGSENLKSFPDKIDKIAASFIEEIMLVNPDGPFSLAGHCTGGIIAFEMALQLKAMGKKVHLLAMFDTIIRKMEKPERASLKNLYNIPVSVQGALSKILFKLNFETFLLRKHTKKAIEYKMRSIKALMKRVKKKEIKPDKDKIEDNGLEIFSESSDVYTTAHRKYKLTPYDGEIILFYAKDRYFFTDANENIRFKKISLTDNTKLTWRHFATSISIYDVEGDHSDMFEPIHGNKFAMLLQQELNKNINEPQTEIKVAEPC